MQFFLTTASELPKIAQRLGAEHSRRVQKGQQGVEHLFEALAAAAMKVDLEPLRPMDVGRTLHCFAKARAVHAALFEALASYPARHALSFRALEMADVVNSLLTA
ncbi:hypothetical protein DIPPA_24281 [Diplonema papillatum]|nr:hypothetical protein DIPPA_24281 [Diplonema papillatum]